MISTIYIEEGLFESPIQRPGVGSFIPRRQRLGTSGSIPSPVHRDSDCSHLPCCLAICRWWPDGLETRGMNGGPKWTQHKCAHFWAFICVANDFGPLCLHVLFWKLVQLPSKTYDIYLYTVWTIWVYFWLEMLGCTNMITTWWISHCHICSTEWNMKLRLQHPKKLHSTVLLVVKNHGLVTIDGIVIYIIWYMICIIYIHIYCVYIYIVYIYILCIYICSTYIVYSIYIYIYSI